MYVEVLKAVKKWFSVPFLIRQAEGLGVCVGVVATINIQKAALKQLFVKTNI